MRTTTFRTQPDNIHHMDFHLKRNKKKTSALSQPFITLKRDKIYILYLYTNCNSRNRYFVLTNKARN